MTEIEVITYEEERLNYFLEQRNRMQNRYERWAKIIDKQDLPYLSEDLQMLSELGRELSFYNDVIDLLKQKEKNDKVDALESYKGE